MKRTGLYLGVLFTMLIFGQFLQMQFGARMSSFWGEKHSSSLGWRKIGLSKNQFLNQWKSYPKDTTKIPPFLFLKDDLYVLKDTIKGIINCLQIEEDSPFSEEKILFYQAAFSKAGFQNLSFIEVNWGHWILNQKKLKTDAQIILSKKELAQKIAANHLVFAIVGQRYRDEKLSWEDTLFFSPLFGPFILGLFFTIIWLFNRGGRWTSGFLAIPKWKLFALLLTAFIIWDTWRYTQIQYSKIHTIGLNWPNLLTLEILISLASIPGYLLFIWLKKKYFENWKFTDAEAAKFAFIFLGLTIYNFSHGYVDALYPICRPSF